MLVAAPVASEAAGPRRGGAAAGSATCTVGGAQRARPRQLLRRLASGPSPCRWPASTRPAGAGSRPAGVRGPGAGTWCARGRRARAAAPANSGEKTYTPALIRYGDGGASMKSSDVAEPVRLHRAPRDPRAGQREGRRRRPARRGSRPSRAARNGSRCRRWSRTRARSGRGRRAAAYFRPPPRPSGSVSTTVVTCSGRSADVQPLLEDLGEMAAGDHGVGDALLGEPGKLVADDRRARCRGSRPSAWAGRRCTGAAASPGRRPGRRPA